MNKNNTQFAMLLLAAGGLYLVCKMYPDLKKLVERLWRVVGLGKKEEFKPGHIDPTNSLRSPYNWTTYGDNSWDWLEKGRKLPPYLADEPLSDEPASMDDVRFPKADFVPALEPDMNDGGKMADEPGCPIDLSSSEPALNPAPVPPPNSCAVPTTMNTELTTYPGGDLEPPLLTNDVPLTGNLPVACRVDQMNIPQAEVTTSMHPEEAEASYDQMMKERFDEKVQAVSGNSSGVESPYVYMAININNYYKGTIVFELFMDQLPKTCKNFKALCVSQLPGQGYKGSYFHRIIRDFMIQGGDFTNGDGTGGRSIYGERFEDEGFLYSHDRPGMLSMANAGPNSNGSQFFITTGDARHLDGKHVVFGRVIQGMEVVRDIEQIHVQTGPDGQPNGRPMMKVQIVDCGEAQMGPPSRKLMDARAG